jgi:hypothetical protein
MPLKLTSCGTTALFVFGGADGATCVVCWATAANVRLPIAAIRLKLIFALFIFFLPHRVFLKARRRNETKPSTLASGDFAEHLIAL